MILIADSGSTKTKWRILTDKNKINQAETAGFNPYHHEAAILEREMQEALLPQLKRAEIKQVFYYGTGCSSAQNVAKVSQAIQKIFPGAEVEVTHDMLAAARSLCGEQAGIACILGTGANSCYYDGRQIEYNVPGVGFILGDEGSGAFLGKQLLTAFLRKELPVEIIERLEKRFDLSKDSILANVYQGATPARYMASFSKFIFQNLKTPELYQLVYDGIHLFFEKNICKYERYQELPVHFTGSVAFYYANILRQVAADMKVNVRNITEDPIAGLALYHQKFMDK